MRFENAALRKEPAEERERQAALLRKRRSIFDALRLVETSKFRFRTLEDIKTLARLISFAFPDPDKARQGLLEIMTNAVEHGNLEIGFLEKARLLEDGTLDVEIDRRLAHARYGARAAEAVLARKPEGVYVVVKDEGPGFDWREYVKFSPARATHKNGRGIQVARLTCFDKLTFNEKGDQVTAFSAAFGAARPSGTGEAGPEFDRKSKDPQTGAASAAQG